MIVQICVGSSCHLKGSQEIIEQLRNAVAERHLENKVTLAGSFCSGQCNRTGVTITVDDEVFPGVNRENFSQFFETHIADKLKGNRG